MERIPFVLEDAEQRASLDDRVAAARQLGERDPRAGTFSHVEAGSFLRGTVPPEGEPGEWPQSQVLTSAYDIGVAPVTVMEFARFVAHGYADRARWSEAGWEWKERTEAVRPRF